jgi:PleD family two-component response regulator
LPLVIFEAQPEAAAKHKCTSGISEPTSFEGSASFPWNRLKFGPLQTCIKYQSVEEPPVRILVVEDDSLVRELVVEALREEGYEVIHAANGEQAMAWCKRQIADVLVTDIRLPGEVDGWQIAERCREQDPR